MHEALWLWMCGKEGRRTGGNSGRDGNVRESLLWIGLTNWFTILINRLSHRLFLSFSFLRLLPLRGHTRPIRSAVGISLHGEVACWRMGCMPWEVASWLGCVKVGDTMWYCIVLSLYRY